MSGKKELNEKQIFVRNLPFDVTSEDLTTLFEDIGPLKNTSVAQTNGVGKGFGFVKFALESDANLAIEKLQGTLFHGRKLILELGLKKERVGRNKEANASAEDGETEEKEAEETTEPTKAAGKKEAKAKPVAAAVSAADHDGSVKKSRQVLIFGIPMDVTKKHFRAISTRGYKKTDVDLLKEDHELSAELHIMTPAGKIMLMTSPSRQEAVKVAAALNNATVHSLIVAHQNNHVIEVAKQELINKKKLAKVKEGAKPPLNAVPNNALEGLDLAKPRKDKLFARTVAQITPLEQRKRKCRLIIRNLSYLATEQNVLDKMSKFGPIVSVELPKKAAPERVETGKTRKFPVKDRSEPKEHSMGFGFVTFLCEADAQYVVEKVTGLKVCNREVAVDFCMSKETYEKFGKKQDDTTEAGEEGSDGEKSDADEEESQRDDKEEGSDAGSDAGSEDEDGSDVDSQASENLEDDDEEDSNADSDGESDKEEKEEEVKPKAKKEPTEDVHEGCTVFVRGLPFDADSNDLKFALGKYGRISLALVVKDKTTDISKGSAFVKFIKPEFASACVTASQLAGGLSIKDRTCKIDLAVDRQSAQSIKDSEVAKRGKDKRNMYLANEGLIIPVTEGSDEHNHGPTKAANMSEADKEKRQRAQSEKNKKLQNPLFFVSATRLSIRNLGKTVNDKELREICLNAAKNGIKKGLVKRADMEAYRAAQGSDFITAQLAVLKGKTTDLDAVPPAVGKQCLKNAKIMLDMQRIRGGAPQSRGYAFCEFTHHAHALAALRELNNNAAYSSHHSNAANTGAADPNGGKLIVEFSLENIQKVKILKDREVRAKNRNGTSEAEEGGVTARQLKRQHKTEEFLQNGGVEGLANKAAAAASAAATAGAAKEEEAPVKKAFKPTKSYVVSPDTLPVVPPEGVNLKIFNKQLEKERQKKRKLEIKEHPELAEPKEKKVKVAKVAPAVAAAPAIVTPVVAAAAKVEVKAQAKAAPVQVQASQPQQNQSQGKGQKRKQEETPVAATVPTRAAPVAVAAKKEKAPAHGEKKAAPVAAAPAAAAVAQPAKKAKVDTPAPVAAPAVSAPAAEKKEKVAFKDAKKTNQSPAKPSNNNNNSNGNGKFDNKNKNDKSHNNSNNNSTNADGTPQKKAWGGHKRLRAMKLKGGKK